MKPDVCLHLGSQPTGIEGNLNSVKHNCWVTIQLPQVHPSSMHLLSMLWYDYAGLNVIHIKYSVRSNIQFISLSYNS